MRDGIHYRIAPVFTVDQLAARSNFGSYSCQASTEHFEQCAEFALLPNRRLGALAVTVLAIPLARRGAATDCAAVQAAAALFRRG
jgi:hypothetical protein